jgi:hypothetical protein
MLSGRSGTGVTGWTGIRYPHVIRPFRHWRHSLDSRLGCACPNFIFRLQTIRCSVLLYSGPHRLSKPYLEYLAWTFSYSRPSMAAYHFLCLKIAVCGSACWQTTYMQFFRPFTSHIKTRLGKIFHIHVSCSKDVRVWNTRRTLDSDIGWVVLHKKVTILYAYILLD